MSNAMIGCKKSMPGWLGGLFRGMVGIVLAVLPLGGLVFFFELTSPASLPAQSVHFATLSSTIDAPTKGGAPASKLPVVHFHGVSAELSTRRVAKNAPSFSASDAERVFASLSSTVLLPGYESEFVSGDSRRIAVRIVSRDAAGDQIIPDSERAMLPTPASTSKLVTFVWGPWIYRAELEDKGAADAGIVVQKVL